MIHTGFAFAPRMQFFGQLRIKSTVSRLGVPVDEFVAALTTTNHPVVIGKAKAINGEYEITGLSHKTKYLLLVRDRSSAPVNAAVSDYVEATA